MGYLQTVRFVCIVLLDITVVASSPLSLWKKKHNFGRSMCYFLLFRSCKDDTFFIIVKAVGKKKRGAISQEAAVHVHGERTYRLINNMSLL